MVDSKDFIYGKIPHRPPFLWVDKVVHIDADHIIAQKKIPADLDIFQGHYPHHPIMPGVILCEAVFQAGAILIADLLQHEKNGAAPFPDGVPVLTRITAAKFKREVKPGDTVTLKVKLTEKIGPAWFLKGKVEVHNKTAVKVSFACTLTKKKEA